MIRKLKKTNHKRPMLNLKENILPEGHIGKYYGIRKSKGPTKVRRKRLMYIAGKTLKKIL